MKKKLLYSGVAVLLIGVVTVGMLALGSDKKKYKGKMLGISEEKHIEQAFNLEFKLQNGAGIGEKVGDLARSRNDPYGELNVKAAPPKENTEEQKIAYLSFDDGPGKYTMELLDMLKERNIKATFFLVGSNITPENEPIVKRISEEGHTIGIHCNEHNYDKIYASEQSYFDDFKAAFDRVYEVTGKKPTTFRFPGGSTNKKLKPYLESISRQMAERGFTCFDWNVSTGDGSSRTSTQRVLDVAASNFNNYKEPVFLMHDVKKSTVDAVPDLIRMIQESGYEFGTLDNRKELTFRPRVTT